MMSTIKTTSPKNWILESVRVLLFILFIPFVGLIATVFAPAVFFVVFIMATGNFAFGAKEMIL